MVNCCLSCIGHKRSESKFVIEVVIDHVQLPTYSNNGFMTSMYLNIFSFGCLHERIKKGSKCSVGRVQLRRMRESLKCSVKPWGTCEIGMCKGGETFWGVRLA